MKRYILFFILTISTAVLSQNSYLNLSLYDDSEFTVQFDALDYYGTGNTAEFDNISSGEHFLRVVRSDYGDVLFSGNIKVPANQAVYAVIDEYGSFLIYKKVRFDRRHETTCRCGHRKYTDNSNNKKWNDKERPNDECRFRIMKDDDFRDLKRTINNMAFESSNITILKGVLDKNKVSAEQVRELLSYFTFEDNKIEIAKYAYKSTCDKKNYFKIYEAFTFSTSIDEVKEYIEKQPQ